MERARTLRSIRAKIEIAEIPQARHDIGAIIQAFVNLGGDNSDARKLRQHRFKSFRRGHEINVNNLFFQHAALFQPLNRHERGAARRQHRIEDKDKTLVNIARQPLFEKHRLGGLFVALNENMADADALGDFPNAVFHAQPGAHDRHGADFADEFRADIFRAGAGFHDFFPHGDEIQALFNQQAVHAVGIKNEIVAFGVFVADNREQYPQLRGHAQGRHLQVLFSVDIFCHRWFPIHLS